MSRLRRRSVGCRRTRRPVTALESLNTDSTSITYGSMPTRPRLIAFRTRPLSEASDQHHIDDIASVSTTTHRHNFTLESGGDQWRRQDLVSGGHDDRGADARASTRQRRRVRSGIGERCPLSSRLEGVGERRELPQRGPGQSPGRYRIFCMFYATELFWWQEKY